MSAFELLENYQYPSGRSPEQLMRDAREFERVAHELKIRASYHYAQVKRASGLNVPEIKTNEPAEGQYSEVYQFEMHGPNYEVIESNCAGYKVAI